MTASSYLLNIELVTELMIKKTKFTKKD